MYGVIHTGKYLYHSDEEEAYSALFQLFFLELNEVNQLLSFMDLSVTSLLNHLGCLTKHLADIFYGGKVLPALEL